MQQGGGIGRGGGGGGMRLGGGRGRGMGLPSDMSDAEMARYMRSPGMQLPGSRGGSDMMTAMMGGGGDRGGGPGEYGGFFGMPSGTSSFAQFAGRPGNEFGMERGPERGGGGLGVWPPEQPPNSLGVGGQGMFDSGGRDRDADLRPLDQRADRNRVSVNRLATVPPPDQQQQQQQYPNVETSADVSRESTKPRVVRFADEESAMQPKPPAVPSTNVHDLHEAKVCSVCQHSERGSVELAPIKSILTLISYSFCLHNGILTYNLSSLHPVTNC